MEYEIDISRLRRDMKDYYGTAMFNGFPDSNCIIVAERQKR